jgi:hypothetical protein
VIDLGALILFVLAIVLTVASFFIDGWPAIYMLIAAFGIAVFAWIVERRERRFR